MPKNTWGVICFESWGVTRFSGNISFSPQAKTKETSETDFITHALWHWTSVATTLPLFYVPHLFHKLGVHAPSHSGAKNPH